MGFRIKTAIPTLRYDGEQAALAGGGILANKIYLMERWLPKAQTVKGFGYVCSGVGNADFGLYTADFKLIASTGLLALGAANNYLQRLLAANVLVGAGTYFFALTASAVCFQKTLNVEPCYTQLVAGALPASLSLSNLLYDTDSNFPARVAVVFA